MSRSANRLKRRRSRRLASFALGREDSEPGCKFIMKGTPRDISSGLMTARGFETANRVNWDLHMRGKMISRDDSIPGYLRSACSANGVTLWQFMTLPKNSEGKMVTSSSWTWELSLFNK